MNIRYSMYMPKLPVSVTLTDQNLLWLRAQTTAGKRRSLSDTLDEIVSRARSRGEGPTAARSVVGTIDISADDPDLAAADEYIRDLFGRSVGRPAAGRVRPASSRARGRGGRG